ncbi:MAG: glycosyltransferase family 4 protein [Anaerolineae bacterium]|nr:glycosyltransferase family 4 protein [Anaerolineae bacterium]
MDTSKYVLVISHDVVGAQMAGPGIRYYHLARVLAREFPTILAVPVGSTLPAPTDFSVIVYNSGCDADLENAIRSARAVIAPALWIAQAPALAESQVPLVIDGYDPYIAETLVLHPDAVIHQQTDLTQAYLLGDFFICASERQRDWWLGLLEANGRINPYTYAEAPSLRRLIDVVPFGLPETPLQHTRQVIKGVWQGIGETDCVILWGGGLWPWLDPLTAIRAVAQACKQRSDIRLIFPGTRHPNPLLSGIATHNQSACDLAMELGLLDKVVFFGDWIAYDDWQNVLSESDLALTLHSDETLESRLAFRSRVLDYIWAGLPIIATRGDATSELITKYDLGITVAPRDVNAIAEAILRLLDTPRESWYERFDRARRDLTWERAARPLIEFCRAPRRAPDKIALGAHLGNPYYMKQMAQLQDECAQLRAERDAAQTLIKAYERRKVVRLLNQLRSIQARVRIR